MTAKTSNMSHSLYNYFKYDPTATKNIQKVYVKFFKGSSRVLDIACGRGEFLELLSENRIPAVGIELDQELSKNLNSRSLCCICDDIFNYLKNSEDNSFDGIFSSHFIEHLEPKSIVELLELCFKVLKSNSVIVITTPNVASLPMHLDHFYRDFTHIKFYHPKIIEFFLQYSGFSIIESGTNENFWFRSPICTLSGTDQEFIESIPEIVRYPMKYINLNDEFKKIKYNITKNPFIFLKRKITDILTNYFLDPQFNEINKFMNHQISNFNLQAEMFEKQALAIREINSWVASLYPPSEVYVVAKKR